MSSDGYRQNGFLGPVPQHPDVGFRSHSQRRLMLGPAGIGFGGLATQPNVLEQLVLGGLAAIGTVDLNGQAVHGLRLFAPALDGPEDVQFEAAAVRERGVAADVLVGDEFVLDARAQDVVHGDRAVGRCNGCGGGAVGAVGGGSARRGVPTDLQSGSGCIVTGRNVVDVEAKVKEVGTIGEPLVGCVVCVSNELLLEFDLK